MSQSVEKIEAPVLDGEKNAWIDAVPLNGVRVRAVHLTHPLVVSCESKKFGGTVCWRGVTERFDFELNGDGPFLHRRILFQSALAWSFDAVKLTEARVPASGWHRGPAVRVTDGSVSSELRRLFGQAADVRTLLYGNVIANGVTVLEDRRRQLQGSKAGSRRSKKYWNGFGKNKNGVVLKYDLSDSGSVQSSLLEGSNGQHVYVVDIFQYGINGLDLKLSDAVVVGKKREGEDPVKPSLSKRHKPSGGVVTNMEDLVMSDCCLTGNAADDMVAFERPVSGMVRVVSNMKLYWYDPK